jgi:hypothetical protein
VPYIIRPVKLRGFVGALLGAGALMGVLPAVSAAAACPQQSSSSLLAALGDNASYFLLEGSPFQGPATGWSLTAANVSPEGPPPLPPAAPTAPAGPPAPPAGPPAPPGPPVPTVGPGGPPGPPAPAGPGGSVQITSNGQAVSPSFCVNEEEPTFRLYARQVNGGSSWSSGHLQVSIRYTNASGATVEVPATVSAESNQGPWALSPVLGLATALGSVAEGGKTVQVQLVFKTTGGSSWAISDVFIDPYSR